jgi:hypothetical protein
MLCRLIGVGDLERRLSFLDITLHHIDRIIFARLKRYVCHKDFARISLISVLRQEENMTALHDAGYSETPGASCVSCATSTKVLASQYVVKIRLSRVDGSACCSSPTHIPPFLLYNSKPFAIRFATAYNHTKIS